MEQYIIAVKHGFRGRMPGALRSQLEDIDGLLIVGDANPFRIHAEASQDAIERARQRVAGYCHIEPLTPLRPARR